MADTEISEVNPENKKFKEIEKKFGSYGFHIDKLIRITNHHLKCTFEGEAWKLKQMKPKNFTTNIFELYHGTQANWRQLANEGLDERLSSKGRFGRGIYFSDNPKKCCKYSKEDKSSEKPFILICKVILGDMKEYAKGVEDRNLKKEPIKEQKENVTVYYDSVKGQPRDHTEYVIYDKRRVLIKYIVFYSMTESGQTSDNLTHADDHQMEVSDNSSDDESFASVSDNEVNPNDQEPVKEQIEKMEVPTKEQQEQKTLALKQLINFNNILPPNDFKELIHAFIQTYGTDETLARLYPEAVSSLELIQPISALVSSSDTQDINLLIQQFCEITNCTDRDKCRILLRQNMMNLDRAIGMYFDQIN